MNQVTVGGSTTVSGGHSHSPITWAHNEELKIAAMIAHELSIFGRGKHSLKALLDEEIKRVEAIRRRMLAIIDTAKAAIENEDELPMSELIVALRGFV